MQVNKAPQDLAGPALNGPDINFLILFPVSASRQDAVCHSIMHIMRQIRQSYLTLKNSCTKKWGSLINISTDLALIMFFYHTIGRLPFLTVK